MKRKELVKELRGLGLPELRSRAKQIAEEQLKLRFRQAAGQLNESHRLKSLRRQLARVQTMIVAAKGSVAAGTAKKQAVNG